MALPRTVTFAERTDPISQSKPWYLRDVPTPVAVAVMSPLVLLALTAALFLLAVVVAALAMLLVAPGLGFVYLIFPSSPFSTRPLHIAIAVVVGAAIWALVFSALARVVRWFALSSRAKHFSPPTKPAA